MRLIHPALAVIQAKRRAGGGGGGGTTPGTATQHAFYAFDNTVAGEGNDDTSGNGHHLTETGSPTYNTSGETYGITTDGAPGAYFRQGTVDDAFGNTDIDYTISMRVQFKTGIANDDYALGINGAKNSIQYDTAANGFFGKIGNVNYTTEVVPAIDTWYNIVLTHNAAASEGKVYINGTLVKTISVAAGTYSTGEMFIGYTSGTDTNPMWISQLILDLQLWDQDNVTWVHNGGVKRAREEF